MAEPEAQPDVAPESGSEVSSAENCVFCGIIAGKIPGEIVYQDPQVVAFKDVQPKAPTHILVVPREHIESLATVSTQQRDIPGMLVRAASVIARMEGVAQKGYRLAINTGADSGNTVAHLHLHLLAGRKLGAMA